MEWRSVFNPMTGRYSQGFDPSKLYLFRRFGEEKVSSFRMSEQSPFFNVWGLQYRDPLEQMLAA